MILTVTANPTIDRVLFVRDFAMQDVVRAEREVVSPSGKGVDVSIILNELGANTVAISLNAGLSGEMLAALLVTRHVPHVLLTAQGETRVSVLITDMTDGRQSTVIAPTLRAGPEHLDQLLAQVFYHASQSWGLVCAGSLPPGLPTDTWAQLIKTGRSLGLVTLLDGSGEGLRQGVAEPPHILKINSRELADLAQDDPDALPAWSAPDNLDGLAAALQARLGRWASDAIAITLGSQGALLVTADEGYFAPIVKVPLVSPAGAGDAMSAGIMLARRRGQAWAEALALGVATAAAVVMNAGTAECTAEQVYALLPQVEIRSLFETMA